MKSSKILPIFILRITKYWESVIHGFHHGSCKWWTVNSRSHLIHENFEHNPSLLFIVKKMLHHCYLLCLITNEVISFLPTKLISLLIRKNHCHSLSTERQNLRKKLIFQNCPCHCQTVSVSRRFLYFTFQSIPSDTDNRKDVILFSRKQRKWNPTISFYWSLSYFWEKSHNQKPHIGVDMRRRKISKKPNQETENVSRKANGEKLFNK